MRGWHAASDAALRTVWPVVRSDASAFLCGRNGLSAYMNLAQICAHASAVCRRTRLTLLLPLPRQ